MSLSSYTTTQINNTNPSILNSQSAQIPLLSVDQLTTNMNNSKNILQNLSNKQLEILPANGTRNGSVQKIPFLNNDIKVLTMQ
jgi:hypothetical protein